MQKAGLLGAIAGGDSWSRRPGALRACHQKGQVLALSFPEREVGAAGVPGEKTGLLLSPAASTFTLRAWGGWCTGEGVGHTGLVKVEIQGSGDTLAVKGGGTLSPVRQSQS